MTDDQLVKEMLERDVPVRPELPPDWNDVLARVRALPEVDAAARLRPVARREPRRVRRAVWIAAAALVAAVIASVLAVPWGGGVDFTDRALAAIGDRPIVHAVVETTLPHSAVIDLATGDERPVRNRVEWLFDSRNGSQQWWSSIDGGRPHYLSEGTPDLALTAFAAGYRDALASGRAQVVDEREVDGRQVNILRFDSEGQSTDVAVDAATYLPLSFSSRGDERVWHVVTIESLDRVPAELAPVEPEPSLSARVRDLRRLAVADAAMALGQPTVWPGARVGELELTSIRLQRLTTVESPGLRRQREGLGLLLAYEGAEDWLEIAEAPTWEVAYGFYGPRLAASGPLPPEGALRVDCDTCGPGGHAPEYKPIWQAQLKRGGLYVRVRSPSRDLVIAAARDLEPMR